MPNRLMKLFTLSTAVILLMLVILLVLPSSTAAQQAPIVQLDAKVDLYDLGWSPDGELLAVGGVWGTKIFDPTLQEVAQLQGHSGTVVSIAWNPTSTSIATSGGIGDGTIRIWQRNITTNEFTLQTTLFHNHNREFFVSWSPDGNWLASIGADDAPQGFDLLAETEIWNTTTWTLERVINLEYTTTTRSLVWSSDSSTIIGVGRCETDCPTGFYNGVYFADVANGEIQNYININEPEIRAIDLNDAGQLIVTEIRYLSVYDIDSLQKVGHYEFNLHLDRVLWHPDGNQIAFGYKDTAGGILDAATGLITRLPDNYKGTPYGIDWHPNGYLLATAAAQGLIQIWDTRTLPAPSGTPIGTAFVTETPSPTTTPIK